MDSDDKLKRFRLHVVKEIYETEKDYTQALEFTIEHIQSKLYLKAANDNSLSEESLAKLFSNIGQLLQTHKQLIADLDSVLGSSPTADSLIAGCYLKHEAGFRQYKIYGENNEHAQKILYELENDQAFKAFFVGLMLLGGKSDVSISSYLFKPIQRICKYPLLFRELLKYTPVDHSDYHSTNHALSMMKDICSVINEAKRRVERLEQIADWQMTVDGWEGSPVIDTCSELVKEGQLVKISVGNIQERMFFLFDNLLVYCKRNSMFQLISKTEQKALHFRGRIPVANIEIENIEDGTCDYQTSRVQVNNGWKVRNLAKNKWFVLIAKTPGEKQQWMDAIRSQKDRIERVRAGFARDARTVMLDKGEKLHRRLINEGKVIQDHRYRFRVYSKSFAGNDFSKWLIEIGEAGDYSEAVRLGQALLENGVIHHVADRHQFKNSQFIYRFRVDDGTLRLTNQSLDILAKGLRVYATLHSLFNTLIRDHRSGLRQMKASITGSVLVDWLTEEKYYNSRDEAVNFCTHLMAIGFLKHISDDHKFKDSNSLYYQFMSDVVGNEHLPVQTTDFVPIATCTCLAVMVPYDFTVKTYGFEVDDCRIAAVDCGSAAEAVGLTVGLEIIGIGGQYINNATSPYYQCMSAIDSHKQMEASLEIIVKRSCEVFIKLDLKKEQLGFQLKGSLPVVVNKVDKGLQAAQLGMVPGCCVVAVNGNDMSNHSHDKVVKAIKKSKDEGQEQLELQIGIAGTQQFTQYQFESSDDVLIELSERIVESPFIFTIPSQLFKLYDEEARNRAKLLSQRKQCTSLAIEDYVTELQVQADNYRKAANSLSNPRYPSYRPFGLPPSRVIESCPINLHTITMEVSPSTRTSSSPTPSLDPEGSLASTLEGSSKSLTGHCISTMAMPCLMNRSHSIKHLEILQQCQGVRDLLARLDSLYLEIIRDSDLLQRLSKEDPTGGTSPLLTTLPRKFRTQSNPRSPTSSPLPGYYSMDSPALGTRMNYGHGRSRNVSFVNPSPLVKIVLDGVCSKISDLEQLISSVSFDEMIHKGKEEVNKVAPGDLLSEWKKRLSSLKETLASLPDSPSDVKRFADSLSENIRAIKNDATFYLEVALAIYDNVEATDSWDRLFCHCLVAAVTGFASLLLIAARGQLNNAPEFIKDSTLASQQWLDFIAAKGVLVCFRTLLLPNVSAELAGLKDLSALTNCLKSVNFHIREQANPKPNIGNLPTVSLAGDHNHLHVTFELPLSLLEYIPESLFTGEAISLHPVIFNTPLQDIAKNEFEKNMNEESLLEMKAYYRGLRQYHLSKAVLPEDAVERTVALQDIARPLTVLDDLILQLEGNVHQSVKQGTQTQVILSELCQRIGCVSVLVCDSGVHRSQSCASVEQTLFLSRCHGLQSRNFRSALSTLRKTGSLPYIEGKNTSAKGVGSLKRSPWLYRVSES